MNGWTQGNLGLIRWNLLFSQLINLLNLRIFVCKKVQGYAQSKVFFSSIYNNSNYSFYQHGLAAGPSKSIEKPNKDPRRRKRCIHLINLSHSKYQSPAQKLRGEQYHQLKPQINAIQKSVQVRCCNNIIDDNILMFLSQKLYNYQYFHGSFFGVFFNFSLFSRLFHIFQQVSLWSKKISNKIMQERASKTIFLIYFFLSISFSSEINYNVCKFRLQTFFKINEIFILWKIFCC